MSRRREVASGQTYRRVGAGGGVWEVAGVRKDGMGTPHAMLRRIDDPNTLKTLSVATLLDSTQFEPVD